MENKTNIFFLLFGISVILNIIAEATQSVNLIFATKPLLMFFLSLAFYQNVRENFTIFHRLILGGLILSIFGDTFLMFNENGRGGELFFLLGLGSFLLTHLFYTAAFLKYSSAEKGFVQQNKWLFLPFALFLAANTVFLWKGISTDMKIPVFIYSSAIVAMTISCLNLKTKMSAHIFKIIFGGVLLFLISDSIIGINKFHTPLPYARLLIMIPYLVGQYFIAQGASLPASKLK